VLVALQDWGTRFVMGDGSITATSAATSLEARRVQRLVGTRVPQLRLPASDESEQDPVTHDAWTVLYCFPGAFAPAPNAYPRNWRDVPGASGCTLESTTYRDHAATFAEAGTAVRGVSTQRPDQLEAFAQHADLPFTLLSDQDSRLSAALRLPTFRAAGQLRLKRLTLILDSDRLIRSVQFPIADPAASVKDALDTIQHLRHAAAAASGRP
jgi:peroxiredoxin